jgi:Na+-driven multidrug efflux pump
LAYLGVRPPAFLGIESLGTVGLWVAFAVSNTAGAVIAYLWYRRGTWRDADVRGDPGVDDDGTTDPDPDAVPVDD